MEVSNILFTPTADGIKVIAPIRKVPALVVCLSQYRLAYLDNGSGQAFYEDDTYSGVISVRNLTIQVKELPDGFIESLTKEIQDETA